jgi:HK97 gp10 family phage protein
MGIKAKIDTREWDAALAKLAGPLRVSLARSMAVAGGEVIRDEAKARVHSHNGVLQDAIYLAFRDQRSTDDLVVYGVSWNRAKAPHGHLVEFGHWQPYVVVKKSDGTWVTTKTRRSTPAWIPAHPFLRPAFEATRELAHAAMIARGRERLPELLKDAS